MKLLKKLHRLDGWWWVLVFGCGFVFLSLLVSANKSLWRDEAFSALTAQYNPLEIVSISVDDFNPPAFYLLLSVWLLLGQSDVWLRGLTLIISLLTIGILYWVSELLFARMLPSWFRALVIVSSINLLYFSAELRGYNLLMLAISVGFLALVFWFRQPRQLTGLTRYYWPSLWTMSQAVILYTHNLGIVWVFCHTAVVLLYLGLKRDWRRLGALLPLLLLLGVVYLPWFSVIWEQSQRQAADFWLDFHPITSLNQFTGLFLVNEGVVRDQLYYDQLFSLLGWLSLLGAITFVLTSIKATVRQFGIRLSHLPDRTLLAPTIALRSIAYISILSLLLACVFFYTYSIFKSPILYWRYVAMLTPPALVVLLLGYEVLWKLLRPVAVFFLFLQLLLTAAVVRDLISGNSKTDYRALQEIKAPIYTRDGLDIQPCEFYADCYFVGEFSEKDRYNGSAQLPGIKRVPSMTLIEDELVYVLFRDPQVIDKLVLQTQGYSQQWERSLGDGVMLAEFRR